MNSSIAQSNEIIEEIHSNYNHKLLSVAKKGYGFKCKMKTLQQNAWLLRQLIDLTEKEHALSTPCSYPDETLESSVIGQRHRARAVHWMLRVNERFGFNSETFFHSVNILDRFLAVVRANSKYLRCISISCLFLAAKINEEDEVIPSTTVFVRESECGCSVAEVLRMELCILDKLNWNIQSTTSIDFLHIFYGLLFVDCSIHASTRQCTPPLKLLNWMEDKLQQCLISADLLRYSSFAQATAVVCVAMEATGRRDLTFTFIEQLSAFIYVDVKPILRCKEWLLRHALTIERSWSLSSNEESSNSSDDDSSNPKGNNYDYSNSHLMANESHVQCTSSLVLYLQVWRANKCRVASASVTDDSIYDGIKLLYDTVVY